MTSIDVKSDELQVTAVRRIGWLTGLVCVGLLSACEKPPPRTFEVFMEDRIAREGTLFRCNEEPNGGIDDIECAEAKRAAAVIALRAERERRETLERESELKLAALREEMAERARRAREAAILAAAAEEAAYEALWSADLDRQPHLAPIEVPVGRISLPAEAD